MGSYDRNAAADPGRSKAQNRATVQQLKLIGQSHQTGLTVNLLKLFEPRPPLDYKPPIEKRKLPSYGGIAQCVAEFANPGEPEYAPPVTKGETSVQKKARIRAAKLAEGERKVQEELEKYDPNNDPNIEGDPYKTLFVARVSYETTETKVKREFEAYGPIKKIRMVSDKNSGKPRGYAFVEFQHTRDMKTAYKQADGRKIDNRRVIVDVERGRTVPNWRPRRLGGGLGSTRIGGDEVNQRHSGREPQVLTANTPKTEGRPPAAHEERAPPEERERLDLERQPEPERERERERERGERDRERERGGYGDRERERGVGYGDRERLRESGKDRERERDRDPRGGFGGGGSERDRDRERERRHRDRERPSRGGGDRGDRDRERERDRRGDRGERSHSRDHERERQEERLWLSSVLHVPNNPQAAEKSARERMRFVGKQRSVTRSYVTTTTRDGVDDGELVTYTTLA
eukprot:jgi/Mesen1/10233/ME000774S09578